MWFGGIRFIHISMRWGIGGGWHNYIYIYILMKKIPKAEATIIDDANGKPKKNKK